MGPHICSWGSSLRGPGGSRQVRPRPRRNNAVAAGRRPGSRARDRIGRRHPLPHAAPHMRTGGSLAQGRAAPTFQWPPEGRQPPGTPGRPSRQQTQSARLGHPDPRLVAARARANTPPSALALAGRRGHRMPRRPRLGGARTGGRGACPNGNKPTSAAGRKLPHPGEVAPAPAPLLCGAPHGGAAGPTERASFDTLPGNGS